ncbi:transposase [Candidatus Kuenenia sp.]|uniref:IS66 family transposase n=1 Tax=Candidatus Kuenenia sp. TaxID=2499824 RepID=UPI0032201ECF
MTIENIDVDATLRKVEKLLSEEKGLSPAVRSMIELLVLSITLLAGRLNRNSRNSSKPPSSDPNRKRESKAKGERKAGGQNGRDGVTLKKVDNPDEVEVIKVDRRKYPRSKYKVVGYEARQVFDIKISRVVTEYRAEVVEDAKGNRIVASFPEGVTKAVQYGPDLKRNLLERLRKYEGDVLRFMDNKNVPFTNNLAENDIRMTKVQQKISGCFRSLEGAKIFCRIRSYLSTCRKQGVNLSRALQMLFRGELPDFASS